MRFSFCTAAFTALLMVDSALGHDESQNVGESCADATDAKHRRSKQVDTEEDAMATRRQLLLAKRRCNVLRSQLVLIADRALLLRWVWNALHCMQIYIGIRRDSLFFFHQACHAAFSADYSIHECTYGSSQKTMAKSAGPQQSACTMHTFINRWCLLQDSFDLSAEHVRTRPFSDFPTVASLNFRSFWLDLSLEFSVEQYCLTCNTKEDRIAILFF